MPFTFSWFYRRMGASYFFLYGGFQVLSTMVITIATVGIFSLYEDMSPERFWEITLVSLVLVNLGGLYAAIKVVPVVKPLIRWVKEGKDPAGAAEAWQEAARLPRRMVLANGWQPFAIVVIPVCVYFTARFGLPWYSALVIFAGSMIAVIYATVLHFFSSEQFLKPLMADISARLPGDVPFEPVGVPLRWKMLGALPLINVITGVVVSGLSATGTQSINDLGLDVIVAVGVAFTISFELTLLVTKSVLGPVDDLIGTTERVKQGDLSARAPVTSGDELGLLADSFNEMLDGLAEREVLRSALGSYVDPEVAERVLAEGELLEGQEVEVTAVFVDVRDFTPFAEHSSARETVAFLNDFFDTVVPIVLRHGGHANKFIGDGMLACFGAPAPLRDHAGAAVAAARDMALAVEQRFGGEVAIGVGLNSGPVVVGSVGGGGRLEFTVIGDTVNVAARVESATRETGDTVLLTEATRCLIERPDRVTLEPRAAVELKGKSEAVPLYAAVLAVDGRTSPGAARLTADA
jgi:class 3 adenylate cyclase